MSGPWQPIWVTAILGFFHEYEFLSNFYPSEVNYEGMTYCTVEHAFQAAKTVDGRVRTWIQIQKTPGKAKKQGRSLLLRPDWEKVKYDIMKELVTQKFTRHQKLGEQLLSTGDKYLEETNHWGDTYWGVCRGKGTNHLGKILMEVRDELRT